MIDIGEQADNLSPCQGCGKLIRADYAFCKECSQIETQEDSLLNEDGYLPLRLRRRYARAKAIFEVGVWSAKSMDYLFGVMVGSMAGVRNSYNEVRQDNRNMRKELAKMGLVYEDCFCGELSPVSHEFTKRDGTLGVTMGELWHVHGFLRFEEIMLAGDLHSVISPLWGKIHGSQVVDVKVLYDVGKVIKYNVKEAVKGYCNDGSQGRRLLMSDSWIPAGYRKVDKMLTRWALVHSYDWECEPSMPDEGNVLRLDFVPMVWEVKRDYLKRWCQGEPIALEFGDYRVYIQGEKIVKPDGMKLCSESASG